MSSLLDVLATFDEAFRSRSRLASLYSDFRAQRQTNPDGYAANAAAWTRALGAAARAGRLPGGPPGAAAPDRFVLHAGEQLVRALQTPDLGRPLALGAVLEEAVRKREMVPLREFEAARPSAYGKSWVPTPWQVMSWGLRRLGVTGDAADGEDRLAEGRFVIMGNVEAAAKAVLDRAARMASSNTSRIFSRDLFASTFSSALGVEAMSEADASILLTHLARDRSAIAYSPATGTVKFKALGDAAPSPITAEDDNIASIRTLIAALEPQIDELTEQMARLDVKARGAVTKKQLTTARAALRSKKLAESKLQQRSATLAQLEEVFAKIEQAADQVEMVRVMDAARHTLRALHRQTGGVERVHDVVDGLREEMQTTDEIQHALNDVSAGAVDEGEVEDELEALEQVERERRARAAEDERTAGEASERTEREAREAREAEEVRQKLADLEPPGKVGVDTAPTEPTAAS